MGVPKFFRYISERYPCLSELIRENQVPVFDNLYLDMNGIIHNCSHPNDSDVHFRISEEQIFKDIFHYLEFLFRMIKPQKLFFIAIDGVAPRAKMNQQRGRRFRSAKEAQDLISKAEKKGDVLPLEERFDSNCITPGTAFMVRLQNALKHFVQAKISTDALWKHCKVILSGHETPGEGEHKIMEYIRFDKSKPGFDPNTRHCLYGLDADLVMLGLCTHEKHFSLLREEVKFGKNDKKTTLVEEIRFYLLHLSLLRDYLELEFMPIKNHLKFEFDIEKLIDDWILMGYLVGNDFIPHLPNLHINEDGLPTLYRAYMDVITQLDGYINEGGKLNLARFEKYMNRLGDFDKHIFEQKYEDLKFLESKRNDNEAFDVDLEDIKETSTKHMDLLAFIDQNNQLYDDDDDGEDHNEEFFEKEFHLYKRNYYITKMGYEEMTPEVIAEQTECYIRALQWTLYYYYRGVQSWSWYYPHHYAPFISDIQNFKHLKIDFDVGTPFLPFQQLLSVLPAASKAHLPTAYHWLMQNPESPVVDYYPENFDSDLNGKQQSWEAVVLIPFIDEKRLLRAMKPCDERLSPEEKSRNIHGPMLVYQYNQTSQGSLDIKYGFPYIEKLFCTTQLVERKDLFVPEHKMVLGPSKGAFMDTYYPGFPTMKHLNYTGMLRNQRVKVFNMQSRNESMVLILDNPVENFKSTPELAKDILNKIIYVSWPHLQEARVDRVSDFEKSYKYNGDVIENNQKSFKLDCQMINDHHKNRLAIDLGDIKQLVHVKTCIGYQYEFKDDKFVLRKVWNSIESSFPVQAIVQNLKMMRDHRKPVARIDEMFAVGDTVFLTGTEFYGAKGEVLDTIVGKSKIKVALTIHEEPNCQAAQMIHDIISTNYMNVYDAASSIGISMNALNRVTGTIFVVPGQKRFIDKDDSTKQNIGLQLRMVTKDEETVGYTKRDDRKWLFSKKAIELVKLYHEKLPIIFELFERGAKNDVYFEEEVFGCDTSEENEMEEKLTMKGFIAWLKSQDHLKAEKRPCGTETLEKEAVVKLAETIDNLKSVPKIGKVLFVNPYELHKQELKGVARAPDSRTEFQLFDRVILVRNSEIAPLGYKGTIIGIHFVKDPNPVRQDCLKKVDKYFDILFDEKFPNGTTIHGLEGIRDRVGRVSEAGVLNITFGRELYNMNNKYQNTSRNSQGPRIFPAEFVEAMQTGIKPKLEMPGRNNGSDLRNRIEQRLEKTKPDKAFDNRGRNESNSVVVVQQNRDNFQKMWSNLKAGPPMQPPKEAKPWDDAVNKIINRTTEQSFDQRSKNSLSDSGSVDSTSFLKKMLKITEDGQEIQLEQPTLLHIAQRQASNVDDFFKAAKQAEKKPNVFPPPPPLSWRSKSEPKQNVPLQQIHHQKSQSIPQQKMPLTVPPPPFQQVHMHPPPTMPMPAFYQPMQQPIRPRYSSQVYQSNNFNRQRPNGPQILGQNRNNPGAFVPLQAERKNAKPKSQPTSSNAFVQKNFHRRQITEQKLEQVSQSFASFMIGDSSNVNVGATSNFSPLEIGDGSKVNAEEKTVNVDTVVAPKPSEIEKQVIMDEPEPRKPRIAAKFSAV